MKEVEKVKKVKKGKVMKKVMKTDMIRTIKTTSLPGLAPSVADRASARVLLLLHRGRDRDHRDPLDWRVRDRDPQ